MKRSKHSLSHYKLFSMKMGALVPCGLVEVLPGDTFQHAISALIRVSPLVSPVMHPVHARIHHWFVPHRLVWEDWEKFITGGPDGMDASAFPTITMNSTVSAVGSLADYFGIPAIVAAEDVPVSALPFRGYQLIYNEWYRDQDLSTPAVIDKTSGVDTTTDTGLEYVAWEKDYFTSARPWTQKGPEVTLPLVGNAPVAGIGIATTAGAPSSGPFVNDSALGTTQYSFGMPSGTDPSILVRTNNASPPVPNVIADLSNVSAASINDLRLAFALQRYEEARARYGSRYTEYLRYLGVRSSDARLQRPEYLGGGKQTVQFSEVLQTGGDSTGDPTGVGNLRGHGIGAMRSNRYRRFFEEHGYVFSFISVKPRTVYAQGISKTFLRRVKEDFWQKELQHIGQQEVSNQEIYGVTSGTIGSTFGYQDRYDEYRRQESGVSGEFRTTLDYWHMARIFASAPVLNNAFVTADPTDRVFADQTGSDTLYVMASHSLQARRMVAKSGSSFIF